MTRDMFTRYTRYTVHIGTDQGEDQVGVCGGWDGGHRQGGEGVVAYARTDDDHGCGESWMVDTDRGLRE